MEHLQKLVGRTPSQVTVALSEIGFVFEEKKGDYYYFLSGSTKVIVLVKDRAVAEIIAK